mgnify:CR=1 FL=1
MSKTSAMRDIDERTNLAGNSMFELLLFRLGEAPGTQKRELFGINVFKVREIMVMPEITAMVNAPASVMGVANIRGQMITVINLPQVVGCKPTKGLGILLVTEFARTTQAFAVEEVNEIVRLEWKQVLSAENTGGGLVTSIARLDGNAENTRLAQVLDVEQIDDLGEAELRALLTVLGYEDEAKAKGVRRLQVSLRKIVEENNKQAGGATELKKDQKVTYTHSDGTEYEAWIAGPEWVTKETGKVEKGKLRVYFEDESWDDVALSTITA